MTDGTTIRGSSSSLRRSAQALARETDGQALVEFSLVLTVLMLIVMGILYFGRALNYSIDETHLANEAARFAAVNVNPGQGSGVTLQQYVLGQVDSNELKNGSSAVPQPAQMTICFPNGTSNVGDPVEVKVTSTFHFIPILNLGNASITGTAVMRLEAPPTNYTAVGSC